MQNMPMRRLSPASLAGLFVGLLLLAPLGAAPLSALGANPTGTGQAYKWVDDKGITHYGDSIPPEYAKRERSVLNRQGVEVRRLEAERTPEQIAAAEVRDAERRKRRDRDQFLLTTYTSAKDIEALRDQRLQQIGDQRKSMESYIDTLTSRLDALQIRAQTFRPYNPSPDARRMPDQLAEELVRAINEVRRQRMSVDSRRNEETQLSDEFQSDIDRFRALKSGNGENR